MPKSASRPVDTPVRTAVCGRRVDLTEGYAELAPLVPLPPDVFTQLAKTSRRRLEAKFLATYQGVSGERVDVDDAVFFLTASQAVSVVAKHLADTGVRRIGVPEPTFDNLPRLLRAAGLVPVPFAETDEALLAAAATLDAIYLVLPNNPTGWTPSRRALDELPSVAGRAGCRVVIDRTCRFFQQAQYPDLLVTDPASDFDWIGIEDTGKTWSTGGTKVAFVRAKTTRTLDAIRDGLDTHMKSVPLLNFYVTTEAIALEQGADRVTQAVSQNRAVLAAALEPLGFSLASAPLGVALIRLPADLALGSSRLAEKLLTEGVEIMSGRSFFWNSPESGEAYMRVALARPTEGYPEQIRALAEAIKAFI